MCLTMSSVEFMSFVRRGFDENDQTGKKHADFYKEHIMWSKDDEWLYGVAASVEDSLSSIKGTDH